MFYKVFYTNKLIPQEYGANAIGPFIFIRPKYIDDTGLLEHEKVHVRQFWSTLGLFGIAYYLSKKYRLKYELEAYKEQLKYYAVDKRPLFAQYLSTKYGLDITQQEALELLTD
jgi:hypothetical protein